MPNHGKDDFWTDDDFLKKFKTKTKTQMDKIIASYVFMKSDKLDRDARATNRQFLKLATKIIGENCKSLHPILVKQNQDAFIRDYTYIVGDCNDAGILIHIRNMMIIAIITN